MTNQQTQITSEVVANARLDQQAFGQIFDHFYPIIFAYCMRRLVLRAVAEDIASEVFLKVVKAFGEFPSNEVVEFRRWIFRIATNEINAHLRQAIRRKELLEAAIQLGHVDTEIASETLGLATAVTWEEVYAAIEILTPRDQSVISLRFFASLSHEEIAETLDSKPSTVRVALSRAMAKMREHLQSQGIHSANAIKGAHKYE